MLKILICDDDELILESLRRMLMEVKGSQISEIIAFKKKEALEFYIDNNDETYIIFMDIKLECGNGIELAKKILKTQPNSQIIFISGYDNYYLDVYTARHVYFLKKPISSKLLEEALRVAAENIKNINHNSFVINNKQGVHKIPYDEILYFENDRRQIRVYTANSMFSYYGKFEDLPDRLEKRFRKCHRSYIVNFTRVRELGSKSFLFENKVHVPISKTYYAEVKEAFLEFLGEEFEML